MARQRFTQNNLSEVNSLWLTSIWTIGFSSQSQYATHHHQSSEQTTQRGRQADGGDDVASTGGEGDDDDTVRALKASILQEAAAPLSAKDLLLLLLLVQSVNTAEKGFCLLLAHKIAWADWAGRLVWSGSLWNTQTKWGCGGLWLRLPESGGAIVSALWCLRMDL